MPWSPAPIWSRGSPVWSLASSTPFAMSGDCWSRATKIAQLFESTQDLWQVNPDSHDIDFQVHGAAASKMMLKTNAGQNQVLIL